jgi:hypothetical protein
MDHSFFGTNTVKRKILLFETGEVGGMCARWLMSKKTHEQIYLFI